MNVLRHRTPVEVKENVVPRFAALRNARARACLYGAHRHLPRARGSSFMATRRSTSHAPVSRAARHDARAAAPAPASCTPVPRRSVYAVPAPCTRPSILPPCPRRAPMHGAALRRAARAPWRRTRPRTARVRASPASYAPNRAWWRHGPQVISARPTLSAPRRRAERCRATGYAERRRATGHVGCRRRRTPRARAACRSVACSPARARPAPSPARRAPCRNPAGTDRPAHGNAREALDASPRADCGGPTRVLLCLLQEVISIYLMEYIAKFSRNTPAFVRVRRDSVALSRQLVGHRSQIAYAVGEPLRGAAFVGAVCASARHFFDLRERRDSDAVCPDPDRSQVSRVGRSRAHRGDHGRTWPELRCDLAYRRRYLAFDGGVRAESGRLADLHGGSAMTRRSCLSVCSAVSSGRWQFTVASADVGKTPSCGDPTSWVAREAWTCAFMTLSFENIRSSSPVTAGFRRAASASERGGGFVSLRLGCRGRRRPHAAGTELGDLHELARACDGIGIGRRDGRVPPYL